MMKALLNYQNRSTRVALLAVAGGVFMVMLIWSAVTAFQRHTDAVPLAATDDTNAAPAPRLGDRPAPMISIDTTARTYEEVGVTLPVISTPIVAPPQLPQILPATPAPAQPTGVKFDRNGQVIMVNGQPWTGPVFDSRPIRQVRTQSMRTTAYSPDERSCGKWADGITASGRSVWMNGGRLVAADRSIPFGTILTIPGYNNGNPVQVWDRGGAIRGNRLDLLYPTHEVAMQWGVQEVPVVFWQFVETD